MMNTGLTDAEKESLLKFFLTHCEVKDIEGKVQINFFNSGEIVPFEFAGLVAKAMINLQSSALPVIDKILRGEL